MPLVERVLDTAGQKGTGRWTAETAIELGAPVPSLVEAVIARGLSALKHQRVAAAGHLPPLMDDAVAGVEAGGEITDFEQRHAVVKVFLAGLTRFTPFLLITDRWPHCFAVDELGFDKR